ncbi:uncharacterized protein LOC115565142 [Drosophila navojoa]|uniref:uncharacterized protein LOC115565142 n=1 Tax=Drosophila navojoa TaxID=7232 RepID=UPI000846F02E|nr:uncharacterized protein LOC115565142 [Drosophila navojoa]
MEKECADEMPFNPFYIGPHPSQACSNSKPAVETGRQCSPNYTDTQSLAANPPGPHSSSSQADCSQTTKGNTPAKPAAAPAAAPCGHYPCNDVRR